MSVIEQCKTQGIPVITVVDIYGQTHGVELITVVLVGRYVF